MKVAVFLAIAAALAVIYGVALVIAPDFVSTTYGMTPSAALDLTGRYFGLTLLGRFPVGLLFLLAEVGLDLLAALDLPFAADLLQ